MTKLYDPNTFAHELPIAHRQFVQSVNSVLNNNVDMGTPTQNGNTPQSSYIYGINAGVYTQFNRGNGSGVLVRIAANGVTGTGATYNWANVSATGVPINHGLTNSDGSFRQPIGFHVVDADKDVRVFRTAAPDKNQITLASTDNTSSVTVYIF